MTRMTFAAALRALLVVCTLSVTSVASGASFESQWEAQHGRVWLGRDYWANPMEDWRIREGRVECLGGANRNAALLTHSLDGERGFHMSVRLGMPESGKGYAGFRIGIRDAIDDYRAAALRGNGIELGVTHAGKVFIGDEPDLDATKQAAIENVSLELTAEPSGDQVALTLTARHTGNETVLDTTERTLPAAKLDGLVALVFDGPAVRAAAQANSEGNTPELEARAWFADWQLRGPGVKLHPERAFGPVLWTMHTLSRGVLSMTAQMPPLGDKGVQHVELQVQQDGKWFTVDEAPIDGDARTARFRVANWDAAEDTPYRVACTLDPKAEALRRTYYYHGTVRRDPVGEPVAVAGFTGNQDYVFPNQPLVDNVRHHDPDVLFFSGDQIYENVGGYGIIREPADRSILNYLRKWYLLGWAFGDLMRDRVTVCLPDDHDVYQGNIWGEGGIDPGGIEGHARGGYVQPVDMVNAVHRTQTSHLPKPHDPTPIARGISVYYCDMVYGRISFAILADRMFKSGPEGKVNTWEGRPDHVTDPDIDIEKLDKPGLKLLGDRQIEFLRHWVQDWSGADMKVALSQTIFANVANYHGDDRTFLRADLDSNGWPQSGRNRALRVLRKGFAFHLAGDQHLPSIIHHGVEGWRDSIWSFCVPSIAAGYPRRWIPDEEDRRVRNRPEPGLPNTGDYPGGLNNKVTVYAIGNPEESYRRPPVLRAHDKASGYGIVRLNKKDQTITMECWRFNVDVEAPMPGDQFPGWPRTIHMTDNYGRDAAAWLPTLEVQGMRNPLVRIYKESDGKLVYALRITGNSFAPKVFEPGAYRIIVGEPEADKVKTLSGIESIPEKGGKKLQVAF